MGKIRVLHDSLVDQIAAGEVVERPASVVKELVENAIDAGARNVTVEIRDGGVGLIRVADDGEGMSPEDARLALQRHATSKIAAIEDLDALETLGFRGEALASIASVSRLSLTSRLRTQAAATKITVEGGDVKSVAQAGAASGTTVEARDLFYNVPARLKFLKAQATESAHVSDVVLRAALANPTVRFVLIRDDKRVREYLPVRTLLERAIAAMQGERLAAIEGERDGVGVVAALAAPERARAGALHLHLFVNGRPVRDRAVARAVAFAFGSVLPVGRYPIGIVHVHVPPHEVDVNVHPQKSEVRFARATRVLDVVTRVLEQGLGKATFVPPRAEASDAFWSERLARGPRVGSRGDVDAHPRPSNDSSFPATPYATPSHDPSGAAEDVAEITRIALRGSQGPTRDSGAAPSAELALETGDEALGLMEGRFARLRPLAQVRKTFIVCDGPDGLCVVDQHAADERVRFAQLVRQVEARGIAQQRLLFAERVEASASDVAALEASAREVAALGFEIRALGTTTLGVHAVPALLSRASPTQLVHDLIGELGRTGDRAFGDARDTVLATMACHASIRAGDSLSLQECGALLRALDEVENFAGHCPHGRPILLSIGYDELGRRLGR